MSTLQGNIWWGADFDYHGGVREGTLPPVTIFSTLWCVLVENETTEMSKNS